MIVGSVVGTRLGVAVGFIVGLTAQANTTTIVRLALHRHASQTRLPAYLPEGVIVG
jgi:uncharacterized membrane protein